MSKQQEDEYSKILYEIVLKKLYILQESQKPIQIIHYHNKLIKRNYVNL